MKESKQLRHTRKLLKKQLRLLELLNYEGITLVTLNTPTRQISLAPRHFSVQDLVEDLTDEIKSLKVELGKLLEFVHEEETRQNKLNK